MERYQRIFKESISLDQILDYCKRNNIDIDKKSIFIFEKRYKLEPKPKFRYQLTTDKGTLFLYQASTKNWYIVFDPIHLRVNTGDDLDVYVINSIKDLEKEINELN